MFRDVVAGNQYATYWFNNLLSDIEKSAHPQMIDQVFASVQYYNTLFPGFTVWITGSSLNIVDKSHNDVDLMVVVPGDVIKKVKQDSLTQMWSWYKEGNIDSIRGLASDPRTKMLGLEELLGIVTESLEFTLEIRAQNRPALETRIGSPTEVNRILMDAQQELEAARVKVDGLIDQEKYTLPTDADRTQGYQFGPLVIEFLKHVEAGLGGNYQVEWQKSFSEGYDAGAGANNCYIWALPNAHTDSIGNDAGKVYAGQECPPIHLFLTTEVNQQKAMEKKESFMLEYYTPQERMQPIKLF
jgi:hypothetical protein